MQPVTQPVMQHSRHPRSATRPARGRSAHRLLRRVLTAAALTAMAGGTAVVLASPAGADPSANDWYRLRMCESSNNYSIDTGNAHYGAYQFDLSTWKSVGGSGNPAHASKAEQDARALILYRERGWQPWQCATILGLRNDKDAKSGRISDITVPTGSTTPTPPASTPTPPTTTSIPAFPGGSHWYVYGETSKNIKTFQDQMHKRGYIPAGTGYYGALTRTLVTRLQSLNGLVPTGDIGPNTWRLAWTGTYTKPGTAAAVRVPTFPGGSHWYVYGETSKNIKTFQDQMHKRGYIPAGTGYYGPLTRTLVEQLQRLNGLVPNGYIGPNTWRLAWTGTFHK
jgi:peptidoglycan hydrolase-like protein with peptidoglycan-binding domain